MFHLYLFSQYVLSYIGQLTFLLCETTHNQHRLHETAKNSRGQTAHSKEMSTPDHYPSGGVHATTAGW